MLVATFGVSIVFALQSIVRADDTVAFTANTESFESTPLAVSPSEISGSEQKAFCMGPEFDMGRRGPSRGFRGFGRGVIEVSSEFTEKVTGIAKSHSDVQNLLIQGYNITSVRPVIKTVIDGGGNVVTKATAAEIALEATNGRAYAVVDVEQAKVTRIIVFTVTEIGK